MRMICIWSEEDERPFKGVFFVDDNQTPDEALQSWIDSQWGEDLESGLMTKEYIKELDLKYFFIDPLIGFFTNKVAVDTGSDSEGDVANNFRYQLCRLAEVSEDWAMSSTELDTTLSRFNLESQYT